MVRFINLPLYSRGNIPLCLLYMMLGGSQGRSERYGDEKNVLPLPGIELRMLSRSVHRLVTIPTELFMFLLVKD
jgi:hypothetical protein